MWVGSQQQWQPRRHAVSTPEDARQLPALLQRNGSRERMHPRKNAPSTPTLCCAVLCYVLPLCRNVFGMGVADGVYMWKELGIDSGTMARTLMETCQHMVAAGCEDVYKSKC